MQKLLSHMRAACQQYEMIKEGDRIAVGVSGGKDSVALLAAMANLRIFYPEKFELVAITLDPRFGNPTPRIAEFTGGMLNSVGLQNPGVDHVIAHELPEMKKFFHKPVMANVSGFSIEQYVETCKKLDAQEQVGWLEVNISCPNVHGGGMSFGTDPAMAKEVTQAVKAVTTKPVIIKLSPNVTDIVSIAKACEDAGIACAIVPEQTLEGTTVSSTHIRTLMETGDMEQAVAFLGHPHVLSGQVVPGKQLGRTIGIPTANLQLPDGVLVPRFGVYCCKAIVDGAVYPAVTNVGTRPTVSGHHATVEPWILDYSGDLYGREITLEFYRFLRPEMKFADLSALQAQIHEDAREVRAYFDVM